MIGGDDSETGLVMKKKGEIMTTGISASLTLDLRDKDKSNT